MDSTWFAVDLDGQVAVFDTGEGGCAPTEGFPLGGEAGGADPLETPDLIRALLERRVGELPELAALLPDAAALDRLMEFLDWDDVNDLAVLLGLWVYGNDEGWAVPYHREGFPASPVTVEALGDALGARLKGAVLKLRYADESLIQPGEHGPVTGWSTLWAARDGSIHPIEGAVARAEERAECEALFEDWQEVVRPAEVEDFEDPDRHLVAQVREILAHADSVTSQTSEPTDGGESWMARLQRALFGR